MNELKFLIEEYGFQGPFNWKWEREDETTYIKGKIFVNVATEMSPIVSVGKLRSSIDDFTVELVSEGIKNASRTISVNSLLPKSIRTPSFVQGRGIEDLSIDERYELREIGKRFGTLYAQAELLKSNSHLLSGKFGLFYNIALRIKQRIRSVLHG